MLRHPRLPPPADDGVPDVPGVPGAAEATASMEPDAMQDGARDGRDGRDSPAIIPFPTILHAPRPDDAIMRYDAASVREETWRTADEVGYRDEDAALFLQAVALQQGTIGASEEDGEEADEDAPLYGYPDKGAAGAAPARSTFDVMEFAEAICAEYHWTYRDFMETPWKALLGFSREAQRRHARERKVMEDMRRNGGRPAGSPADGMDPWDESSWSDGSLDTQDYEEARLRALLAQDAPIPWEG